MRINRAEREERAQKEEKQIQIANFKQRGKKRKCISPDVARIFSRRAPSGHHVSNLVRVAFESITFVFLFVF